MNPIIVTPAYTHVHHLVHRAIQRSGLKWLDPLYGNSDLPRARSLLIEEALRRGADRVIFIDADTIPLGPRVLTELAEATTRERAAWGLYVLRDGDKWSVKPEDPEQALGAIDRGDPFRIHTGGLGIACVHRLSLERLGNTLWSIVENDTGNRWRPFCVPLVVREEGGGTAYYADDGSLCYRLRNAGTELWCHPKLRAAHAAESLLTAPRAT